MRLGITTFDPCSRASIGGFEGLTRPLMRWTPVGWPPRLDPAWLFRPTKTFIRL